MGKWGDGKMRAWEDGGMGGQIRLGMVGILRFDKVGHLPQPFPGNIRCVDACNTYCITF